jgi:hypothetical protein
VSQRPLRCLPRCFCLRPLVGEMLVKATGCCKGKGGPNKTIASGNPSETRLAALSCHCGDEFLSKKILDPLKYVFLESSTLPERFLASSAIVSFSGVFASVGPCQPSRPRRIC